MCMPQKRNPLFRRPCVALACSLHLALVPVMSGPVHLSPLLSSRTRPGPCCVALSLGSSPLFRSGPVLLVGRGEDRVPGVQVQRPVLSVCLSQVVSEPHFLETGCGSGW